jgi:CheY-like chemotaxis protein
MDTAAKNILVVDDDPQLRLALSHILRRLGHHVDQAENGHRALQSITAHRTGYDLVVMDIIMPDKEGIETILELRRMRPQLKIIAMSGGGRLYDFDPLKLATDCGANFVIAKPFEPAAMRRMVEACLEA